MCFYHINYTATNYPGHTLSEYHTPVQRFGVEISDSLSSTRPITASMMSLSVALRASAAFAQDTRA